jgi:hypothetical protein
MEYATLSDSDKYELINEFFKTTPGLPNPDNQPMIVKAMFKFFLYSKGYEVPK